MLVLFKLSVVLITSVFRFRMANRLEIMLHHCCIHVPTKYMQNRKPSSPGVSFFIILKIIIYQFIFLFAKRKFGAYVMFCIMCFLSTFLNDASWRKPYLVPVLWVLLYTLFFILINARWRCSCCRWVWTEDCSIYFHEAEPSFFFFFCEVIVMKMYGCGTGLWVESVP